MNVDQPQLAPIQVRFLRPTDDKLQVSAFIAERIQELQGDILPEQAVKDAVDHFSAKNMEVYDNVFLLLTEGEQLQGFASFHYHAGMLYLGGIAVHPAHRRKGHGTRILKEVDRIAQMMCFHKIVTWVRANNARSLALFAANQYTAVIRLEHHFYDRAWFQYEKRVESCLCKPPVPSTAASTTA